jgi:cell division transport system ATP-binding protein
MLEINDVEFSYQNQEVFTGLNFKLLPGEFTFLIGKSGAGKSTFLKLIYMDLFPEKGYVRFEKYDSSVIKNRDIPFLRRKMGVIFQDFKLLRDRTVYDNLAFVLEVTGTPGKEIRKRVFDSLTEVGLLHKQKNYPFELSGGEQQRVAIARAIINHPVLLLADEPTGNLDPETSYEILEILKKINSRGTSVICATHNYDLVRKFNTRIIKLEHNKAVKVVIKPKAVLYT